MKMFLINLSTSESIEGLILLVLLVGMMMLMFFLGAKFSRKRIKKFETKEIEIDKLLHREPIQISDSNIFQQVSGKRILITGAAGSVGSEIARQLSKYHPSMVVLCDQGESGLYEIQMEMEEQFREVTIKTHVVSIRNMRRLRTIFELYRPQFVFHAAAYKHVPMMENDPAEAILTNVLGTVHVADLSVATGVEKFVMISTDKAVNPASIMGASKRIAEIYVQSLHAGGEGEGTRFMITRFGNVMDSSGSVIPRFRKQIMQGGPVTVTHPEIKRFFMTIPEAVRLVLEAASMGRGGEIFVFDMGEPVKISDLAKNMIKLAGLVPEKDIKIVYTGLRPGEKLFEELWNRNESLKSTYHIKIKIAEASGFDYANAKESILALLKMPLAAHRTDLVKRLKQIVPEFIDAEYEQAFLKVRDNRN